MEEKYVDYYFGFADDDDDDDVFDDDYDDDFSDDHVDDVHDFDDSDEMQKTNVKVCRGQYRAIQPSPLFIPHCSGPKW